MESTVTALVSEPKHKSKGRGLPFFLMIIWPFLALVVALNNYKKPWAKNVVWAFTAFFGFTLIIINDKVDAYRYREAFIEMSHVNYSLGTFVGFLYSESSNYVDIVQPLVTFLVSRITSDPRVLFGVFGLIFGYFYSRNIWYVLQHSGPRIRIYFVALIFLFSVIFGIWEINIFRFATAAQVYLFGALPFLLEKKRKYLLYASLSIFFHFSFILPVGILLFFSIVGNRYNFFFIFFIVSLFVSTINFESVKDYSEYFPQLFQEKANEYVNEDYAQYRKDLTEAKNWYSQYYIKALSYTLSLILIVIYTNISKMIKYNRWLVSLFSFTLLFYASFNILGNLPVVVRFIGVANLFSVALIFLFFQHDPRLARNRFLMMISMPVFIWFFAMKMRIASEFTGYNTLVGNPVSAVVIKEEMPILESIKGN